MNQLWEKLLASESISPADKAELAKIDPEEMQRKNAELSAELGKLRELNPEEMRKKNAELSAELDRVKADHARTLRRRALEKLAASSGCLDIDYLDFLAARNEIDLLDEAKAASFAGEAARKSPALFKAPVLSGSVENNSATRPAANTAAAPADAGDKISRIIAELQVL